MGDRLKEYELLFIVSPRVAADDVPNVIERVTALIQDSGGEVLSADSWGRRRLAYPIKHYFEGSYVLLTLRLPPTAAAALEASLIISEEVIRHLFTEGILPPSTRDRGRSMDHGEGRDDMPMPFGAPASEGAASGGLTNDEPMTGEPAAEAEAPEDPAAEAPTDDVIDELADAPQPQPAVAE